MNEMKRSIIAITLSIVFFLLSFNAQACLIPLFGGLQVSQGSDCSMPQEQPARQHCDAFKNLGVQTVSPIQPLSDVVVHDAVVAIALPAQDPLVSLRLFLGESPPLFTRDIFALTPILRI